MKFIIKRLGKKIYNRCEYFGSDSCYLLFSCTNYEEEGIACGIFE